MAMPISSRNDENLPPARAAARGRRSTSASDAVPDDVTRACRSARSQPASRAPAPGRRRSQRRPAARRASTTRAAGFIVAGVPMTSASAGGVNFTSAPATGGLRSLARKSRRTVWPELVLEHHALELVDIAEAPGALHENPHRSPSASTSTQSNPSLRPGGRHREQLANVSVARQQSGGRRRERAVAALDRHLLEIAIVEPQVLAVGDHELRRAARSAPLGREFPAEPARAHDDQRAAARSEPRALAVGDHLRELGAQRLEVLEVAVERRLRLRPRWPAARLASNPMSAASRDHSSRHSLPGGAGARISRAPFGCSGPTTPAFSIDLEQARGAVVADLEPALHVGDGRLAFAW